MQAITSIGKALSGAFQKDGGGFDWGKLLGVGMGGGGFLSNWLQNRKYNSREDYLAGLAKNPVAMREYMSKFEKPLSQGLTKGVGNQVQAFLGERGLSESPTISSDVLAQALAPYQQQSQAMAGNEAFQALGLMPTTRPPQADLSKLLASFGGGKSPGGGGSGVDPSTQNSDPTSSLFDTNSMDPNSFQGAFANG